MRARPWRVEQRGAHGRRPQTIERWENLFQVLEVPGLMVPSFGRRRWRALDSGIARGTALE